MFAEVKLTRFYPAPKHVQIYSEIPVAVYNLPEQLAHLDLEAKFLLDLSS
jgi:hypothetical protein